jgi:hypothetical protein
MRVIHATIHRKQRPEIALQQITTARMDTWCWMSSRWTGLASAMRPDTSVSALFALVVLSFCAMLFLSGTQSFAQATGGTVTEVVVGGSTYRVHTFTSGGTLTVSSPIANIEYLIVAGGGGGGGEAGGGGSGGGVRTGTVAAASGNYNIIVGTGGTGGVARNAGGAEGTNGGDSSFNGIVATGGGRGKTARRGNATGGAGGGGVWSSTAGLPGVAGQIQAGGNSNGNFHGGGGGGAGTAGQNAGGSAGNGGDGKLSTISGASTYYGGGGGGGKSKVSSGNAGTGGLGGGGNGANAGNGAPGTANTGGGGGGGINNNGAQGGSGGSGIVIVRYVIPAPLANAGSDQTVASAANTTLNGSGTSFVTNQTLTYAWTQTAGTAVTLSDTAASQPSFTAPTLFAGDADATLTFSLVVTDNLGQASAADTVTITVTAPGNADGARTIVTANVTTAEALPADDATEAEITATLYDENGNVLSAGGNIVIATTDMGTLRQNPQGMSIPMRDNRNGTYSVWLRSDSVGIATVTITVDGVAAGSVRIVFAKSAVNVIIETETAISGFMLNRANRMVSSQPNLTRFLNDERCGHFNAAGDDFGGSMDGCVQKGNVWYDMTASWGHGTRFMQGTVGAHMVITPNFLLGGIIQFDETKNDTARISGKG